MRQTGVGGIQEMANKVIQAVDDLFNSSVFRKIFLLLRIPATLVLVGALLYYMKKEWFIPGLVVSVIGALGQSWCFSNILTQKELAASGPYVFVRNPMYLTRFFLVLGALMFAGNLWILGVYTLVYWFYMNNRVRREERKLREVFGQPYIDFCAKVPRFMPSFRNVDWSRVVSFRPECFARNNGVPTAIVLAVFYVFAFYCFYFRPFPELIAAARRILGV
jgi:protein-S-isoprenylcysteine O-methyltransferase Ste14